MNASTIPNSDHQPTGSAAVPSESVPPRPAEAPSQAYVTGGYATDYATDYATGGTTYSTSGDQYGYPSPSNFPNRNLGMPPERAQEDPGKVLGIISLVATLSTFLGFNIIGPIVGIVTGHLARKRSKEYGYGDNEMGKWGFVLGIVFLSLAAMGALLGISAGIFGGVLGLLNA